MNTANDLREIDIPDGFLTLCSDWYDGQGDLLYAVASTGGLTLGSRRPLNDDDEPMTDYEWHVHLWLSLSCDISRAARAAEKSGHEDATTLRAFEAYADEISEELSAAYGLID